MRKHIFRGFYPDDRHTTVIVVKGREIRGQWVEGYLYIRNDGVCEICRYDADFNIERYTYEVIPETVSEFTGMIDLKQKNIFEHDVLRLWHGVGSAGQLRREYRCPLPVEYCTNWCQFIVMDREEKQQFGFWQEFMAFEVIGTIFDKEYINGTDK